MRDKMPTRGTLKRIKERAKQEINEARSRGVEALEKARDPEALKKNSSAGFNSNKKDKLSYPLVDRGQYQGQVRFRVVELSPLTAEQLSNLNFVDDILNSDALSKLDDKIDKDESSSSEQEKQKRLDLTNKSAQKLKGNGNNSYDNQSAQKKYAGSVTLYLPTAFRIADAVQYNTGSLGTIGAGVEAGLNNGASALNAVGAGLTQGIDSFTSLFGKGSLDRDASALALTRMSENFAPEGVALGIKSATRVATNPNLRTLLDNVPIRSVPFSFRLVAQSAEEAKEIEKIIKFFRYQLYPDEIAGQIGGATVSLGYKFPDPFEITTTYKGKQVGTKFLDAYLNSVDVTYNEQSMGFHADGYPSDVNIQLNFVESKALTRKLVEEGY